MRFLSTIATMAILIVPAATLTPSVASAESIFNMFKVQKIAQSRSRNSSPRGGPTSFGAAIDGTARFAPPPNNDPIS